ncbi:hypothetical protein [Hydrogenophaga soli]
MVVLFQTRKAFQGFVVGTCLAVLLAGCGSATMPHAASPEQEVARLAQMRWEHLLAHDWAKAYDMLTPGYKKLHSLREYEASFKGGQLWVSAKVVSTVCEPESCEVRVGMQIKNPQARYDNDTITTHFSERWLYEDGRWYHHEKL